MKRFDSTAQFVSRTDKDAPFGHAKKETPDRTINAALPFGLALGAGLTTFIAVGLIAWGMRWHVKWAMIAAGVVMFLVMVWWLYWLAKDDLLWTIEQVWGADINRDGVIGRPQPSEPWRIILEDDRGSQVWLNFDTEELRLKAATVAKLVLNGTSFSEAALTGSNRPLTRTEFYTLRDLFMFHGLLEWKDPESRTLGTKWTAPGRSMIRALASTTQARTRTPRGTEYALPEPVGEWDDEA